MISVAMKNCLQVLGFEALQDGELGSQVYAREYGAPLWLNNNAREDGDDASTTPSFSALTSSDMVIVIVIEVEVMRKPCISGFV